MGYSEFKHYNIVLGCRASRFSMFDANGDEYFAVVPMNGRGSENRAMREKALGAIADALESDPPGQVRVEWA